MKSIVLLCLCLASIEALPSIQQKPILAHPSGRIVEGQLAKDGQFPYMVAVYFDTAEGTYFCGGALVDEHWVLTSGHCTYHANIFTLHLGSNNLVTDDPNRVTVAATYSVAHPDYNPDSFDHDIGLIRIDANITLNEYIRVIPVDNAALQGGIDVTVSGWGASGDWDGVTPDLNYVGLKSITNTECKSIYGEAIITDGMVCAVGSDIEGTCNGDSGGPLVISDGSGHDIHVGIVSWASASGCLTNHPSGYTRTDYYYDWIQSIIRSKNVNKSEHLCTL